MRPVPVTSGTERILAVAIPDAFVGVTFDRLPRLVVNATVVPGVTGWPNRSVTVAVMRASAMPFARIRGASTARVSSPAASCARLIVAVASADPDAARTLTGPTVVPATNIASAMPSFVRRIGPTIVPSPEMISNVTIVPSGIGLPMLSRALAVSVASLAPSAGRLAGSACRMMSAVVGGSTNCTSALPARLTPKRAVTWATPVVDAATRVAAASPRASVVTGEFTVPRFVEKSIRAPATGVPSSRTKSRATI